MKCAKISAPEKTAFGTPRGKSSPHRIAKFRFKVFFHYIFVILCF